MTVCGPETYIQADLCRGDHITVQTEQFQAGFLNILGF